MTLSEDRKDQVRAFKKEAILQAAKQVFAEAGLLGASIRSIAKASGYTPGAIYSYFDSKEHIYAEILAGVLDNVLVQMEQSVAQAETNAVSPAHACISALYDYYSDRPDEFHLSYYLFDGMRRKGLNVELDMMLNKRLDLLIGALNAALADTAETNVGLVSGMSAMAHVTGILLLKHTGRLRTQGHSGADLIASYLALISRP